MIKGAKPRAQGLGNAFESQARALIKVVAKQAPRQAGVPAAIQPCPPKGREKVVQAGATHLDPLLSDGLSVANAAELERTGGIEIAGYCGDDQEELCGSPPKDQMLGKRDFVSPAKGSPLSPSRQSRLGYTLNKKTNLPKRNLQF